MAEPLRIATRSSELALSQAREVAARLEQTGRLVELAPIGPASTPPPSGQPLDKSRFVSGVEAALLEGRADIGVHSAKDLPGAATPGLHLAGTLPRAAIADAWVGNPELGSQPRSLDEVPQGARVGTASIRRRSQLLALRPDLEVEELRGNVDTRIRLLRERGLDAAILAEAGLARLGREAEITFTFPPDQMLPAAGQGALALQVRDGDEEADAAVAAIADVQAMRALLAERALVVGLAADCDSPVAASARVQGELLEVGAYVGRADGSEWIRDSLTGPAAEAELLGERLAKRMLSLGAVEILGR